MDAALEEHVATLRQQARFTIVALRKTADLLDRLNLDEVTAAQIDRTRSQARAALRALRSTNQLLAQAAELATVIPDREAAGGTANGTDVRHTARLG